MTTLNSLKSCQHLCIVSSSVTDHDQCADCGELMDRRQKIRVFYNIEPIFHTAEHHDGFYRLHRDRNPDAGWSEFRWGKMDDGHNISEVLLTQELKKILIEDIIEYYKGSAGYEKMKEFDLIK